MRYLCCDMQRREAVRAAAGINGIEYLEVIDSEATDQAMRQRVLHVHLLKAMASGAPAPGPHEVHIEGGTRVTSIDVTGVEFGPPIGGGTDPDRATLAITVDRTGDFSLYTLRLGPAGGGTLAGFDPLLSSVEFSFKVECPTDFDCEEDRACPPAALDAPAIDYLARDYASFRQLMLDRLSVVMPDWRDRNAADLGIALVEVLAYTADHLSYQLDAIGMEATLATARRRASAKRHARLVDYTMHDGSNARAWVQIRVGEQADEDEPIPDVDAFVPQGTILLSRVASVGTMIPSGSDAERRALAANPIVFETMHDVTLHSRLNRMPFYTWGDRDCCLPAGATSATLRGDFPMLDEGMVLVFVESIGPRTGDAADADTDHRHAIRLIDVKASEDPIGSWFDAPDEPAGPVPVTEIRWADEDALPFALCISATDRDGDYHDDVSVALGNIVLADHGRTVRRFLPEVPRSDARLAVVPSGGSHCDPVEPVPAPPRYTPTLDDAPLTMAGTTGRVPSDAADRRWARFDPSASATSAMQWEPRHILPEIRLDEIGAGRSWSPRRDLLASDAFRTEFIAEVDADGRATLRFGDDEFGMRAPERAVFEAEYRVGNGPVGNVGADALHHIVITDNRITGVSNPMPARGGTAPESVEHVRRSAPSAFRIKQRAVTPEDYAEMAERHWQVQRARATERWTGSWYTIFLTIDRVGGLDVTPGFETEVRSHLERYRMAGHDIEIDGPRFVWLELELRVCVLPEYYRGDVRRELLDIFGSGFRADGQPGFFHPDNFTFNQPVYLSRIYAAAQRVPGVRFVEALVFQRLGDEGTSALVSGELAIGRLEIARLDNDPSFPDRGVVRLTMEGGR